MVGNRVRRAAVVILLLFVVGVGAVSQCATTAFIDFGPGGRPGSPLIDPATGGPLYAAMVVDGATFLDAPGGSPLDQSLPFLEVVRIYRKSEDDRHWLVERASSEPVVLCDKFEDLMLLADRYQWRWCGSQEWGWIRADEALLSSAERGTPVVIRSESADEALALPVYLGPGEDYRRAGGTDPFRPYHALAKRSSTDGAPFVLLGYDPHWRVAVPGTSIIGWVPEDRVFFWRSGRAVSPRKEPGHERVTIYDSLGAVRRRDKRRVIGREDRTAEPVPAAAMVRFPILERKGDALRIAWVGQPRRGKGLPAVRRFRDLARGPSLGGPADLLFVVDATAGMAPHLEAVGRAVAGMKGPGRRIAMALYRDYTDGEAAFQMLQGFEDGGPALSPVLGHSSPRDRNFPEAVYHGIIEAVGAIGWDRIRCRVVIVVGDHGNHRRDPTHSRGEVVEALRRQDVAFYGVNLEAAGGATPPNRLFQNQIRRLLADHGERGFAYAVESATTMRMDRLAAVLTRVFRDAAGHCPLHDGQDYRLRAIASPRRRLAAASAVSPPLRFLTEGWVTGPPGGTGLDEWALVGETDMGLLVAALSVLADATISAEEWAREAGDRLATLTGALIEGTDTLAAYLARHTHLPSQAFTSALDVSLARLQDRFRDRPAAFADFQKNLGRALELCRLVKESRAADLSWDRARQRWQRRNMKPFRWWWVNGGGSPYA